MFDKANNTRILIWRVNGEWWMVTGSQMRMTLTQLPASGCQTDSLQMQRPQHCHLSSTCPSPFSTPLMLPLIPPLGLFTLALNLISFNAVSLFTQLSVAAATFFIPCTRNVLDLFCSCFNLSELVTGNNLHGSAFYLF